MSRFLFIFLFLPGPTLFLWNGANASIQDGQTYKVFAEQEQAIDENKLFVYEDKTNEKEFDYIQSIPDNFYTPLTNFKSLDNDKTYWIKFRIQNTTNNDFSFILFTGTNARETIYFIRNGRVSERKAGYLVPASERELPLGYKSKARLDIASQEAVVVYVRTQSLDRFAPRFDIKLVSEEVWTKEAQSTQLFEGIFTGLLLILSFLGLIFFAYTGSREFLYYGLYTLSNCIYFLNYYGYLDLYIFPNNPEYLMPIWILVTLSAVFYFAFARAFIDTREAFPKWHKVFGLAMKIMVAVYLINVIFLLSTHDARSAIILHNSFNILICLMTLIFIVSISTKKMMVVRYFSLGTAFLLITVLFTSYQYLIAFESQMPYIAQVGILIEVLLFSLGIGHKIKRDFHNHNITQESLIIQLTENERLQLSINQELEEKVAERTHLINDQKLQLQKAWKEAEMATKAKTEFLSVMSHEIRTPLNAIISLSHLMEIENESAETQEYIDALKFSAESLHSLINDILDYNKIESGKIDLESTEFSLIDQLKNICESFKYKASSKEVRLILEVGDHTPDRIMGDPTRLTQIFNNLIGNALKFTHEGNVTIAASLKGIKDDAAVVSFKVSDTGIGIPKEKLDEIFEDYEQASRETTRKYGGTGLGLAITKKLIELHNSSIEVHSVEGEGTQFNFDIEFIINDSMQIFDDADEVDQTKNLDKADILVVDDSDMNRLVLKRFFSMWNANCQEARNGYEALELVEKTVFDLILMDLEMDGINGFETTRQIRRDSKLNKEGRIVAMTAQRASDLQDKIRESAMQDLISKPFEPQELYQKIKYYLLLDEEKI
ncbi:MAG: response regulator [Roseivirga sp.]|nr:response regulator [Roseivirga sp.]